MNINLSDLPDGVWATIGLVITSPILTSIVMFFLNRNRTRAEVDNIIGKSYNDLLEAYKDERVLMAGELQEMRKQQSLYIENSNHLMQSNRDLGIEINKLKEDHKHCNEANIQLKRNLKDINEKLENNGIK